MNQEHVTYGHFLAHAEGQEEGHSDKVEKGYAGGGIGDQDGQVYDSHQKGGGPKGEWNGGNAHAHGQKIISSEFTTPGGQGGQKHHKGFFGVLQNMESVDKGVSQFFQWIVKFFGCQTDEKIDNADCCFFEKN